MQRRAGATRAALAGVALALVLAGCGSTSGNQRPGTQPVPTVPPSSNGSQAAPPAKLVKVRFTEVIHSVFYAPQYVAQAKGFFRDEGIDLDTSTAQGSDKGTAALLAGTADIALVGPETAVFVHNQDTPNKVKLFAQLTAQDGSFLLARQPQPNFKWEDVRGKTIIGWRQGSMPQMVAADILRQHGLRPGQDVTYVSNLAAPAMAGAFQSGQGDYIQVFEPVASQLEKAGVAHVVASLGTAYGPVPYTGYAATEQYIAGNPDVIQRFTRAIYRAMLYIRNTDPAVVAKEIAQYFPETDASLLESALRRYRAEGAWKANPVMAPGDYDRLQALMIAGGVLEAGKQVPFAKLAVNTFAERAVQEVK